MEELEEKLPETFLACSTCVDNGCAGEFVNITAKHLLELVLPTVPGT